MRGNDGALAPRRARRAQRPGRRAQRLYASAARPDCGGRDERKRPSHPDRRDPGDRQRRGGQRGARRARAFAIAGRARPSDLSRRGSVGRACPRLRPPRRRRGGDRRRPCASSRAAPGRSCGFRRCPARASPPARTITSPTCRGMRDRHQHGRGRRQCKPDDDRIGCRSRNRRAEMSDDLTNSQISLLCDIEEHDPAKSSSDEKRDLERLIAEATCSRRQTIRARPLSSRPRLSRFSASAAPG